MNINEFIKKFEIKYNNSNFFAACIKTFLVSVIPGMIYIFIVLNNIGKAAYYHIPINYLFPYNDDLSNIIFFFAFVVFLVLFLNLMFLYAASYAKSKSNIIIAYIEFCIATLFSFLIILTFYFYLRFNVPFFLTLRIIFLSSITIYSLILLGIFYLPVTIISWTLCSKKINNKIQPKKIIMKTMDSKEALTSKFKFKSNKKSIKIKKISCIKLATSFSLIIVSFSIGLGISIQTSYNSEKSSQYFKIICFEDNAEYAVIYEMNDQYLLSPCTINTTNQAVIFNNIEQQIIKNKEGLTYTVERLTPQIVAN